MTFGVDTIAPTWGSMINSTAASYSQSALSYFNISWDGNPQTVLFESNFSGTSQNYSTYLISGSVYGFNATLSAGTFYWKSIANDSVGNTNSSEIQMFTIARATPSLSLLLDSAAADKSVTYGAQTNATASEGNNGDGDLIYNLYRNEVAIINPDIAVLGANTYIYVYNTTGGGNYTAGSVSRTLTVNKGSSSIALYINGVEQNTSQTYGTDSNITAIGTNGVATLYRDGTAVTNPEIITLKAGAYNYTAIIEESANISRSAKSFFLVIDKATPSLNLLINGTDSDKALSVNSVV